MVLGAGGVEPRPYGEQEDLCKPGVGRTEASAPTEALQGVQWAGDRKGRPYGSVTRSAGERGIPQSRLRRASPL